MKWKEKKADGSSKSGQFLLSLQQKKLKQKVEVGELKKMKIVIMSL